MEMTEPSEGRKLPHPQPFLQRRLADLERFLAVITFFAGAVFATATKDFIGQQLLARSTIMSLIMVFISLLAIGFMLKLGFQGQRAQGSLLLSKAEEIDNKIDLKVKYVEGAKSRASIFRELRTITMQARDYICFVTTFDSAIDLPDSGDEATEERRLFHDSLLERARGGVQYNKVIQLESGETFKGRHQNDGLVCHLREMLSTRENLPSQVGLIEVRPSIPMTFILIDDRYLMLEFDKRDAKGRHMAGILIFDDPRQVITPTFRGFYQSIVNQPEGSIKLEDLPTVTIQEK